MIDFNTVLAANVRAQTIVYTLEIVSSRVIPGFELKTVVAKVLPSITAENFIINTKFDFPLNKIDVLTIHHNKYAMIGLVESFSYQP